MNNNISDPIFKYNPARTSLKSLCSMPFYGTFKNNIQLINSLVRFIGHLLCYKKLIKGTIILSLLLCHSEWVFVSLYAQIPSHRHIRDGRQATRHLLGRENTHRSVARHIKIPYPMQCLAFRDLESVIPSL